MDIEVVTLADRPDLLEAAFALGPPEHRFMQEDQTGWLYSTPLMARWAAYTLVLLDGDRAIARASTVPFSLGVERGDVLPLDGFDGVLRWAAEDALAERTPNCLAALEINVAVERRGEGVSGRALDAVRALARSHGFDEVVCPVRPTEKANSPRLSIEQYVEMKRPDGLPVDPWLRVHMRAGGEIVAVAPFSMTVSGTLAQWRDWTGLAFDDDGEVEVPGALMPVMVNRTRDFAVYVEPNVWVRHLANASA